MIDHITAGDLFRLARLADFPAVGPVPAGAAAWEDAVARAILGERREIASAIAPWFTPELVATPWGWERLAHWFALGRPPLSRRAVSRDVVALGGRRACVVAALRRMPPPVEHFVVHHAWIITIAGRMGGWTQHAPPIPAGGPLHLITLDGRELPEAFATLLAHEVAHAWLESCPTGRPISERERLRTVRRGQRLAIAWGQGAALSHGRARVERRAANLAASWGFRGPGADPEVCANTEHVRAGLQIAAGRETEPLILRPTPPGLGSSAGDPVSGSDGCAVSLVTAPETHER